MRICVCGGRDYQDAEKVNHILSRIHHIKPISSLMNGGAKGADKLSSDWAISNAIPLVVINADWDLYGKSAGAIRNKNMVIIGFDCLVAFPGGNGTKNMITQSLKAKLKIFRVNVI